MSRGESGTSTTRRRVCCVPRNSVFTPNWSRNPRMAELLAVAQTLASPEAAPPESEQRRETESGRSVPTAADQQRRPHDELQHAVGNSAVQHMAADPPEVSRPADPGQGPGLDVVFVFKSSPEDPPEQ